MRSIDTAILLHIFNADSPHHEAAYRWLTSRQDDDAGSILRERD